MSRRAARYTLMKAFFSKQVAIFKLCAFEHPVRGIAHRIGRGSHSPGIRECDSDETGFWFERAVNTRFVSRFLVVGPIFVRKTTQTVRLCKFHFAVQAVSAEVHELATSFDPLFKPIKHCAAPVLRMNAE